MAITQDGLQNALQNAKNKRAALPQYSTGLVQNKANPMVYESNVDPSVGSSNALGTAQDIQQQSMDAMQNMQALQNKQVQMKADKVRETKTNADIAAANAANSKNSADLQSILAGNTAPTGKGMIAGTKMPSSSSALNNSVGVTSKWGVSMPAGVAEQYAKIGKSINPYAKMTTINTAGGKVTVNSTAAKAFQGFINALAAKGYKIHSLSGQINKPVAGTNTPSTHTYGLAIDINADVNPVTKNGKPINNLPPSVQYIAAKYGLYWGGAWNGSKTDSMHFSMKYKGNK